MRLGDKTPRWVYRFDNFEKAFLLLKEAISLGAERPLSQLEKQGVVQRFELTVELSWKVMKDFLEYQNVVLSQVTPRAVIKEAFASRLIIDGQTWLDALDARNKLSHCYDEQLFEAIILSVQSNFLLVIEALYQTLLKEERG